ncbi:MAG TPA: hypothetical protein VFQ65_07875 [Kofleriaceae bacterium]|nr:hypothetical protein [Kofleriaceae bacterium]
MSRWLALAVLVAPALAHADMVQAPPVAPPDMSDQAIGASLGAASGGRVTAGGLRVAGHFLYQLSGRDWFDGTADFTFGRGGAACFRDRTDVFLCDHGLADGGSIELEAAVRHFLGGQGQFWPFVLGGVGLRGVDFSADSVSGFALALHAGGGLRASVSPGVAITAQGELELGFGAFNHTLGIEPQLGVAITAGVEFRL